MIEEQQWEFIACDGKQYGPYSAAQLQGYVSDGTIIPETLVWTEGLDNWLPASEVAGLFPDHPRRSQLITGSSITNTAPPPAVPRKSTGMKKRREVPIESRVCGAFIVLFALLALGTETWWIGVVLLLIGVAGVLGFLPSMKFGSGGPHTGD